MIFLNNITKCHINADFAYKSNGACPYCTILMADAAVLLAAQADIAQAAADTAPAAADSAQPLTEQLAELEQQGQ
jgi:hypothetical protein